MSLVQIQKREISGVFRPRMLMIPILVVATGKCVPGNNTHLPRKLMAKLLNRSRALNED